MRTQVFIHDPLGSSNTRLFLDPYTGEWTDTLYAGADGTLTIKAIANYGSVAESQVDIPLTGATIVSGDSADVTVNADGSITLSNVSGTVGLDIDFDPARFINHTSTGRPILNAAWDNQISDKLFVQTIDISAGQTVEVGGQTLSFGERLKNEGRRGHFSLQDNGDGTANLYYDVAGLSVAQAQNGFGTALIRYGEGITPKTVSGRALFDQNRTDLGPEAIVSSSNTAPVSSEGELGFALTAGQAITIPLNSDLFKSAFQDAELDTITIVDLSSPDGILTNNGNGTVTLLGSAQGGYSLQITASDGALQTQASFPLTAIAPPNGAVASPSVTLLPGMTHGVSSGHDVGHMGQTGHNGSTGSHQGLLKLMPLGGEGGDLNGDSVEDTVIPTHQAQVSGDWFDPVTWGGSAGDYSVIPDTGALVHVPAMMNGRTIEVSYDFGSAAYQAYAADQGTEVPDLFIVRVDGDLTMRASGGAETVMSVDTLFTTAGTTHKSSSFTIDADSGADGNVRIDVTPYDIQADTSLPAYYSDGEADGAKVTPKDFLAYAVESNGAIEATETLVTYTKDETGSEHRQAVVYRKKSDGVQSAEADGFVSLGQDGAGFEYQLRDLSYEGRLTLQDQQNGWRPLTAADGVAAGSQDLLADFMIHAKGELFDSVEDGNGVLGRYLWDPEQLSLGVLTHGSVDIRGQSKTAHANATSDVLAGSSSLQLDADAISDWSVGDTIVIAGTSRGVDVRLSDLDYHEALDAGGVDLSNGTANLRTQDGTPAAFYEYQGQDEERTITNIAANPDGTITVEFDSPLSFDHTISTAGNGETSIIPVANISRNVEIRSSVAVDSDGNVSDANSSALTGKLEGGTHFVTERGHFMAMHNNDVNVDNAAFIGLGRSDKTTTLDELVQINGRTVWVDTGDEVLNKAEDFELENIASSIQNTRGRYGFHMHKTGAGDNAPIEASGNVVNGSVGWGFTHHNSSANLSDNVAYNVRGTGFVSETGNETGTWTNNLSFSNAGIGTNINSFSGSVGHYANYGSGIGHTDQNGDIGQAGIGFWFEGRNLDASDNISVGAARTAFVFNQFGDHQIDTMRAHLDGNTQGSAGGAETVRNRDMPIRDFSDNVSIAAIDGLQITTSRVHNSRKFNDAYSLVEGFEAWNIIGTGIAVDYAGKYIFQGATLVRDSTYRAQGTAEEFSAGTSTGHGVWLETANADNSIINSHAEGFRFFATLENDFNSKNAGFASLLDPNDIGLRYVGGATGNQPVEFYDVGVAQYLTSFRDAEGNLVTLDVDTKEWVFADEDREPYNPVNNLVNTTLSGNTVGPNQAALDGNSDIQERASKVDRFDINGDGSITNDEAGYYFSQDQLPDNQSDVSQLDPVDSYVLDPTIYTNNETHIELLDDSAAGGLVALWREDEGFQSRVVAADATNTGGRLATLSQTMFSETLFMTSYGAIDEDLLRGQSGLSIPGFDGIANTADDPVFAVFLEERYAPESSRLMLPIGTSYEFIDNTSGGVRFDFSQDVYSGTVLEFRKSDEIGSHYFVYNDYNPLDWSQAKNEVTTNERLVFGPDEINATLLRDGYFTMPGVTYTDAGGTQRDMKFVLVENTFSSRLTGDLDTKKILVGLDENWGTSGNNPANKLDWSAVSWAGHVQDTDEIVGGVEANSFIVSGKYGHFRNGSLVIDPITDAGAIFDLEDGAHYFSEDDDVVDLRGITEDKHEGGTINAGAGDDIVYAGSVSEVFEFETGDGQDQLFEFDITKDTLRVNSVTIDLTQHAPTPNVLVTALPGDPNSSRVIYGDGDWVDLLNVAPPTQPANAAPELHPDASLILDEDETATSVNVLSNDIDPDKDALTILDSASASNGQVVRNADGTLTYTPFADFNGNDIITYVVSDGTHSVTGSLNVVVNAVNDAPVPQADPTITLSADTAVSISLEYLLKNDQDVDGDELSVVGPLSSTNGAISFGADGNLHYEPNAGFTGSDIISYSVSDGTTVVDTELEVVLIDDTSLDKSFNLTDALLDAGLGEATSSSDYSSVHRAEFAFDGIANGSNGSLTRFGTNEYIQLDLGAQYEISSVVLTNRSYAQYRLNGGEVVLLDANQQEVHRFDPITGAEDGAPIVLDLSSYTGTQFIRVEQSSGPVQLSEFDVFAPQGTTIDTSLDKSFNLTDALLDAGQGSVTASSQYSSQFGPELAFDGLADGYGALTRFGNDEFIQLDLGAQYDISSVVLSNRSYAPERLNGAEVVLFDASNTEVFRFDPIAGAESGDPIELDLTNFTGAQYVRVEKTTGPVQIGEFDVFAAQGTEVTPTETLSFNLTDALLNAGLGSATSSSQHSNDFGPELAFDGAADGYGALTRYGANEFIQLDLGAQYDVSSIVLTNRSYAPERLNGADVTLLDTNGEVVFAFSPIDGAEDGNPIVLELAQDVNAQFIKIEQEIGRVQLSEFDVFSHLLPGQTIEDFIYP